MKVIICGVVKNAAAHLENNIKLALELGNSCDAFKIIIYENNSTDETKSILKKYSKQKDFVITMENIDEQTIKNESKIWAYTAVTGSDHPCRIEQISNARNKLIQEIKKEDYNEYEYVVMIDFDSKFFYPDGIMNSLKIVRENPNRIIYANSNEYYDYYALRSAHSEYNLFGPEVIGEPFWKNMYINRLKIDTNSADLVPVYSAFNGIGVYTKTAFTATRFDASLIPETKAVYKKLAMKHAAIYEKYKSLIQNECSKFYGGESEPDFFWKNNSGYNKPVVCEHVAFNFTLINAGYEIYINPRMVFWW